MAIDFANLLNGWLNYALGSAVFILLWSGGNWIYEIKKFRTLNNKLDTIIKRLDNIKH